MVTGLRADFGYLQCAPPSPPSSVLIPWTVLQVTACDGLSQAGFSRSILDGSEPSEDLGTQVLRGHPRVDKALTGWSPFLCRLTPPMSKGCVSGYCQVVEVAR